MSRIDCPGCSSLWDRDIDKYCTRCLQRFYIRTPASKMIRAERIREVEYWENIWDENTIPHDLRIRRLSELVGKPVDTHSMSWEAMRHDIARQDKYPGPKGNWDIGQNARPTKKTQSSSFSQLPSLSPSGQWVTPSGGSSQSSGSGSKQLSLPASGFLDDDDDDSGNSVGNGQPRVHSAPTGGFLDDDDDEQDVPF